ncbi:MAG: DUF3467 domain-containing protein [Planctomycetes bacterium]|nr:DUF3467 domain-containing protein [Planctomycetota bacterium]
MPEMKEPPGDSSQPHGPAGADHKQLRLAVDERNMKVTYANAFRAQSTNEEVMIDFGINMVPTGAGQNNQPDMVFQLSDRIVMNYYAAKRLAGSLGQIVRQYEDQYGLIELDPRKRQKK